MSHGHILLVIDHLRGGGAASQMMILARTLNANGYRITIFTYHLGSGPHYDLLCKDGIEVIQCAKGRFKFGIVLALMRLINKTNYCCIISYLTTPNFYAVLAKILSKKNIPVLVSERAAIEANVSLQARLFRAVYFRLCKFVLFNSHDNRKNTEKLYPFIKNKTQTIYNAIDHLSFKIHEQFDETDERKILNILVISTPRPAKNALCLAEALRELRDKNKIMPVVQWLGPIDLDDESVRYVDEITAYLTEQSLLDQWDWLGYRDDVKSLLAQSDVLVHPSYFEGLPNAICEALASGLPIIASDVCDHPRLIGNNQDRGMLFDPYDSKSLACSINEFNQLPVKTLNLMRKNALEYAGTYLSLEKFSKDYMNIILKLTNTSNS